MICRACGTEIADKALICYRCGTATTEAKFKPAAATGRTARRTMLILGVVVALLLVLLAFFLLHSGAGTSTAWPDHSGLRLAAVRLEPPALRLIDRAA